MDNSHWTDFMNKKGVESGGTQPAGAAGGE